MSKKVLIVFGTRPEAIKMAPLVIEFRKKLSEFDTRVCVTGQHRQMLDQVLDLFEITPDYDLNIMTPGQDLYDISTKVLLGVKGVLKQFRADIILVHGDTTTSTFAALAGFYEKIPVGHVEAGLRTFDRYNPWPEEMNRQLTGRLANIHFAPTDWSKNNLLKEGVRNDDIVVTGNTVIDALFQILKRIDSNPLLKAEMYQQLISSGLNHNLFNLWQDGDRKMVLITGHRRENFGDGFLNICNAIRKLAEEFPNVDFVYPVHMNPNVRKPVEDILGIISNDTQQSDRNIYLIEPLSYLPFVGMMRFSTIILTDSGGIQEEALSINKPVVVMRETTERPEALEAGAIKLVGTDESLIIATIREYLSNYSASEKSLSNPYGKGDAAKMIVEKIHQQLHA